MPSAKIARHADRIIGGPGFKSRLTELIRAESARIAAEQGIPQERVLAGLMALITRRRS